MGRVENVASVEDVARGEDVAGVVRSRAGEGTGARAGDAIEDLWRCLVGERGREPGTGELTTGEQHLTEVVSRALDAR